MSELPDRNLAMELVRVTEAAALAASRWTGRGDKLAADQAAVDAMRHLMTSIAMDGLVVIGEGEKDEAPMLYNGEHIGNGMAPLVDIAVDPLEGTTLCAKGKPNALAVIAMSERGTMYDPGPALYMEKLVTDVEAAHVIDITRPIEENIAAVAAAKGKLVPEVSVIMLDRPRHEEMNRRIRDTGARIRLISDGDVAGALIAARADSAIDMLWGVGGTPEGVLAAAAIRCLGGEIQGRLWARNAEETQALQAQGYEIGRVLLSTDLVRGDDIFFAATGVTDGDLLEGVRYGRKHATTQSIVMRSRSGTVRITKSEHDSSKIRHYISNIPGMAAAEPEMLTAAIAASVDGE
ncbi:MAG: class II fructose-bisphosphatase [Thermoleophilia bacterium]|nr:class II fructose-bisphosphatase [Thermoleophilia bacterium]